MADGVPPLVSPRPAGSFLNLAATRHRPLQLSNQGPKKWGERVLTAQNPTRLDRDAASTTAGNGAVVGDQYQGGALLLV